MSQAHLAPRALRHPLWWFALVCLVVNDHVLKGAGVLPGELTGKLSDLAGVLVAPAVLCGCLRWPSPPAIRATLASAAVAIGFAAINLSPAAARGLSLVLQAAVSPVARVWADASDLIALSLLPLGYWLSLPAPARAPVPRGAFARGAVALGALACLASSGIGPSDDEEPEVRSDAPAVQNITTSPLLLVISSTEAAGGCELYRRGQVGILTEEAFVARREIVLEEGERARLVVDSSNIECGAAWLQLPDGEEQFLYWRDLERLEGFVTADDERRADREVQIEGEPGRYRIQLGDDLERFQPRDEIAEPTCETERVEHDLGWSEPPLRQGWLELMEVDRDADDCLMLHWMPLDADAFDGGTPGPQRLCVPAWAFPFDPGDLLSVIAQPASGGGEQLRVTRYREDQLELQLEIWHEASTFEGSLVARAEPLSCFGSLTQCGAYVRPLELEVEGEEDRLRAGDQATSSAGAAEETRLLIGPLRDVAWSSPACAGGEARLGASGSLLELRSY